MWIKPASQLQWRVESEKKERSAGALLSWLKSVIRLELKADGDLRLARIADAHAQEAVEVEQRRSRKRVDVVLVVEKVEDFNPRNQRITFAEVDRARHAEVESKEAVVFAKVIAAAVNRSAVRNHKAGNGVLFAARRAGAIAEHVVGNGLRGVRLHANVGVEAVRKIGDGVE